MLKSKLKKVGRKKRFPFESKHRKQAGLWKPTKP